MPQSLALERPQSLPRPLERLGPWIWPLVFVGVGAFALLMAGQHYTGMLAKKPAVQMPFETMLRASMTQWYGWALLTPLVWWICRRHNFGQARWPRVVALHILLAPVFSTLQSVTHILIDLPVEWILGQPFSPARHFAEIFPGYILTNAGTYWAIVGLCHSFELYGRSRREELKSSELERGLAEARLQVLKMQLQPHFLFNTLHAISALMHRDVEEADRMVARLSQLLRMGLDSVGVQEVPVWQELDLLRPYLEIEEARFRDRLKVSLEIDPAAMNARVPTLVLQPLVENAIRHGIAARAASGQIQVRVVRENGAVILSVKDDGPGLGGRPKESIRKGVGLSNTLARLDGLYGSAHQFQLGDVPGGGFEVKMTLPYREGEARGADTNTDRR